MTRRAEHPPGARSGGIRRGRRRWWRDRRRCRRCSSKVLTWLHRSRAARILANLAEEPAEITHSLLDGLPQNSPTRHVRGLLVAADILPRRNEHLARREHWIAHSVPGLPPHQTTIIRPFVEWCFFRDARRRAARDGYSLSASATPAP
ncbi:hypothetical protein OHB39_38170 [Streptomyces sp. NBC_00047]|uniref:hypothetical protein n=1 Tax=Streptomyces sp. NBC_00047 TaxID=2975627 RepID=UPI0022542FBB|nr:hypothetical protein [Streptomyces sp. NBC_00047]MCX5613303.1 hypothetical protein [Streptomyces sp. NBC_00047]